jgi:hypothetical protein
VAAFANETPKYWSEVTLSNLTDSYKAIRYVSPDWGYGNVAELEFYNGDKKLTGTVFADDGGPWNGLQDRTPDKAFDGNILTFYDANNANGAYVGLELTNCFTPETPKSCALTEIRYTPRLDCCSGRTIGGQIQVSTVGKNGPWQTITTFQGEAKGQTILGYGNSLPGPYKAIRYVAPDWGYGNIAELEFYSGNQKLTGTVFADDGGPWNGLQDRTPDKAFDGDPKTFYDSNNANGAFVGLELTNCSTGANRLAAPETEAAELTWALEVAPNPSSGRVRAQVRMPQPARLTLTLINALGQEISRQEVSAEAGLNTVDVEFSHQPTGLYLLRAQTDGQNTLVRKLLKQDR